MRNVIKTPLEWSHEMRGAIGFHIGTQKGRPVALIRESLHGIAYQCSGYAKAPLHSGRYKNASDIDAAMAMCEIHVRKLSRFETQSVGKV